MSGKRIETVDVAKGLSRERAQRLAAALDGICPTADPAVCYTFSWFRTPDGYTLSAKRARVGDTPAYLCKSELTMLSHLVRGARALMEWTGPVPAEHQHE